MSSTNKGASQKKKTLPGSGISRGALLAASVFNVVLFGGTLFAYFSAKHKLSEAFDLHEKSDSERGFHEARSELELPVPIAEVSSKKASGFVKDVICTDPVWCSIPMPAVSHFNFDPPVDKARWKLAQSQAASGEQVLLSRISKVFPNPFDFLDGDKSFRKIHNTIDVFIDSKADFQALLPGGLPEYHRRRLSNSSDVSVESIMPVEDSVEEVMPEYSQALERELSRRKLRTTVLEGSVPGQETSVEKRQVIPSPYDFRSANRAAIVQIGYIAFKKDGGTYFSGNFMGGVFIKRVDFLTHWAAVKEKIDTSYVAVCVLNENWGWLSSNFPNRTAGWGKCCDRNDKLHKNLYDFLDHEKTLMLVIGQHSNISHPKILTYPRGIPLTWYVLAPPLLHPTSPFYSPFNVPV